MLTDLIKLANLLDSKGKGKQVNEIDKLIKKLAVEHQEDDIMETSLMLYTFVKGIVDGRYNDLEVIRSMAEGMLEEINEDAFFPSQSEELNEFTGTDVFEDNEFQAIVDELEAEEQEDIMTDEMPEGKVLEFKPRS